MRLSQSAKRIVVSWAFATSTSALMLVACSGDDSASGAQDDASTQDGTTSDAQQSDATKSDSGERDTGTTDSAIDTGPTPIACGATSCTPFTELCCVPDFVPVDGGPYCTARPDDAAVVPCKGNYGPSACIDPSDCPAGDMCVAAPFWGDGGAPFGGCGSYAEVQELVEAGLDLPVLCRTTSDCADAAPCVPYTCFGADIGACNGIDKFGCVPR